MASDAGVKGKKKTWSSDGSKVETASGWREIRSNRPWWKSPHRIAERLAKAATRR